MMEDPIATWPTTSSLLRCECRRPPAFERGLVKWSFALLIIGAAALDAFWVMPAERAIEPPRPVDPYIQRCVEPALVPASPELAGSGELRVDGVHLLAPTRAAR